MNRRTDANHPRNRFSTMVVLVFLGLMIGTIAAQAADVVTFDFSRNDGPAGTPIASGFHAGWKDDVPDTLIYPLKPFALNTRLDAQTSLCWGTDGDGTCNNGSCNPQIPHSLSDIDGLLSRAEAVGALADLYTSRYNNVAFEMNPDDSLWWPCYEDNYLTTLMDRADYADSDYHVDTVYEFWPEVNAAAYAGSVEDVYRLWDKTYQAIKGRDSTAVLIAPNFHWPNLVAKVWANHDPTFANLTLDGFLNHARAMGTWPDVIGWHSMDHANAPYNTGPCDCDLVAEIDSIKQILEFNVGLPPDSIAAQQFAVGETYCNFRASYLWPGYQVHIFARAEAAKGLNLMFANQSAPGTEEAVGGELEGVIKKVGPVYVRRNSWWVHKAYADLEGKYVFADQAGVNFDGLGSKDQAKNRVGVLVGNYDDDNNNDYNLVLHLENLDSVPWVTDLGVTRVRVWKYARDAWTDTQDVTGGELILDTRRIVESDSLIVDLTGMLTTGEAVLVQLEDPGLQTRQATQDRDGIVTALANSDLGDAVQVVGASFAYDPFAMKRRVRVFAGSGTPEIRDSLGVRVTFPTDADSLTILDGFRITAADSVTAVVDLNGSGVVQNCTIEDVGKVVSDAVVVIHDAGTLQNSTVTATSGEGPAIRTVDSPAGGSRVENNQISVSLDAGASETRGVILEGDYTTFRGNTVSVSGTGALSGVGVSVPTASGHGSLLEANMVSDVGTGIRVDTGTGFGFVQILKNTTANCTIGAKLVSGRGFTVENNTFAADSVTTTNKGLVLGAALETGVSASYRYNLLLNNGIGIHCEVNPPGIWTFAGNLYWDFGDPNGSSNNSGMTASQIRDDYDIELCEGREGTAAYSQRIDSRALATNNQPTIGHLVGALDVECAFGELVHSTIVDSNRTVRVLEDVTVPPGTTLQMWPGAALRFDGDDDSGGGTNASLNEIIVQGSLRVLGDPGNPAVLEAESGTTGDWSGIVVGQDGAVTVKEAILRDAAFAIRDTVGGPADTIRVENTTLEQFETAGIYLNPANQSGDQDASLTVLGCTVDQTGAPYGIYLNDGFWKAYRTTIGQTTITGNSAGTYGLYLDMVGYGGGRGAGLRDHGDGALERNGDLCEGRLTSSL